VSSFSSFFFGLSFNSVLDRSSHEQFYFIIFLFCPTHQRWIQIWKPFQTKLPIPKKSWWIKSTDIHTCGAIKTCTLTQKGVLPVLHVVFLGHSSLEEAAIKHWWLIGGYDYYFLKGYL
jgi:hypothetical protein